MLVVLAIILVLSCGEVMRRRGDIKVGSPLSSRRTVEWYPLRLFGRVRNIYPLSVLRMRPRADTSYLGAPSTDTQCSPIADTIKFSLSNTQLKKKRATHGVRPQA
jgi:hypothetical protein